MKKRYEDFPRRDIPLSYEDKQVCSAYEQRHPGGTLSMVALGKPRSDVISTFTMTNILVPRISESAVRQFETVNFLT